jgi:hypothetical protein
MHPTADTLPVIKPRRAARRVMRGVRLQKIMIRISPRNLLAVKADSKFYYALVLDKIRLFGGNWAYAFHQASDELLPATELLGAKPGGFHAFIDFIWAKRENRIERVARDIDVEPYNSVCRLKGTNTLTGKADRWFIYDMDFRLLKRTSKLSEKEKRYPLYERIDDAIMVERINQKWVPEVDAHI